MSDIDLDLLRRIRPLARKRNPALVKLLRPLRKELLRSDASNIQELALKIRRYFEILIVFRGRPEIDDFYANIRTRVPGTVIEPIWCRVLTLTRRFDEAEAKAEEIFAEGPSEIGASQLYASTQFLAGKPTTAIAVLNDTFNRLAASGTEIPSQVLETLVEAGNGPSIARRYPELAAASSWGKWAKTLTVPSVSSTKIYCISLDADWRRLETTRAFVEPNCDFRIVAGTRGTALPNIVRNALAVSEDARLTDAELGCAISHLKAWECIAEECEADEYALVIEDDSRFIYGPGRGIQEAVEAAKQKDAGCLFINTRACALLPAPNDVNGIHAIPVQSLTKGDNPLIRKLRSGWGGYGYLLRGDTAKALSEHWSSTGFLCAVDWQMFLMSFEDMNTVPDRWFYRHAHETLMSLPSSKRFLLDSYFLNLALIASRDQGQSSISLI